MNMVIADFVNTSPASQNIGSVEGSLGEIDFPSPIDFYMRRSREVLRYGTTDRLQEYSSLGGFLLLGLISEAEAYFRSILSACLDICPICRKTASEKTINLGGLLWHGIGEFRRSAFEHLSFASQDDLVKASRGYLSFELKDAAFKAPLEQYDLVCNLRHGIVHNASILPGRNAVKLGVKRYDKAVMISVDFSLLQRVGAAIDTLVLTFNRHMFEEMCKRWAVDWRNSPDWNPSKGDDYFSEIWRVFSCTDEHNIREDRNLISLEQCMAKVKSAYNLP